jgi:hypothetical protein
MRTSLITVLVFASAVTSFSQGVVNFNNNNLPSPPDRAVYWMPGVPVVGTNYLAQLYWSTDGGGCFTAVTNAPARFRPAGVGIPGTWLGGNRTFPAGVGGVNVTIQLAVRVWDVFYPDVVGQSSVFDYTQVLLEPPTFRDTTMTNFQSFVVQSSLVDPASQFCIPEPTAAFLLLPGFAALWLLRCRRERQAFISTARR